MRRAIDGWVNRPASDFVLVVVLALLGWWADPQNVPDEGSVSTWLQTLASVNGVLLGLGGVAVTVVFAVTPSDRLAMVYEAAGPRLAKLVLSCLGALVLTTGGFTALFLVPADRTGWRSALTAGLIGLAMLRFARLWWLFRRVLTALMTKSPKVRQQESQPRPTWTRPVVSETDYALSGRKARRRSS